MRDPRTDPRPGDVLRKGDDERHVMGRDETYNGFVFYRQGGPWKRLCRISTWKRTMRDAEVLHVAEEE